MLRSPIRRTLVIGGGTLAALAATAASALQKSVEVDPRPPAAKKKSNKHKVATIGDDGVPDLVTYGRRADVMAFADALAERRGLDPAWVRAALEQSRFVPNVARFIMPPPAGTAKNWAAYRARFVEPIRIRAGVAFWNANEKWLAMAEEVYGVPPEIVVGIVGVESIYGRQMGTFRVIDALATLAFDFPAGRKDRSEFFRDELESWFVLCKSEGIDPLAWKGSYAGAIGMAQFMPSSFNKYAVDLDGDGHVNLHESAADVIGSVAHYMAEFGWKRGLPVRFSVQPPADTADRAALLAPDIVPTFSAAEMQARGAALPPEAASVDSALALVELENGAAAPSYVAGTSNFYAVTRYNWSSYYAMAVVELGEAVQAARGRPR
jgi:membrane-bound lytic murein transglycosylase B